MKIIQLIKKVTHWTLTGIIILLVFTGLGITNYQIVETITFGGLSKLTSFQLHSNLLIPLIVLLGLHIYFTVFWRKKK